MPFTKDFGERMTPYDQLKDLGYLIMWGVVAGLLLTWAIGTYIENVKTIHYWRGRKDGWDMHRRMIDNDVHNN
jgi:hypothetical protein